MKVVIKESHLNAPEIGGIWYATNSEVVVEIAGREVPLKQLIAAYPSPKPMSCKHGGVFRGETCLKCGVYVQ